MGGGVTPPWAPVTVPVQARVGPIHLRLFPYAEPSTEYDDALPWAWGALCRVTFRFGARVVTKRIRTRYSYRDRLGWPQTARPGEPSLTEGRRCVLDNLRMLVAEHGVTPPEPWPFAAAAPADQDEMAGHLHDERGGQPWPNCP